MTEQPPAECPDEQALAAFAEGTLEANQNGGVERHVADCPECLVVVAETARQIFDTDRSRERRRRRGRGRLWLAAAAVVAGAVLGAGVVRHIVNEGDPLHRLREAAAASETRSVEGRLTDFRYRPYDALRAASPSFAPLRLLAEAEQIAERGGDDATSLHARGVAALVTGDRTGAVGLLDRAAAADPLSTAVWNDLAVARDASARPGDRAAYASALAAADRAVTLDPSSPSAHFTRAVTLRHLRRFDDAAAEFERAAALEPKSSWASEAREQVAELHE